MISIRSYFILIILVIETVLADFKIYFMGKFFWVHKWQIENNEIRNKS